VRAADELDEGIERLRDLQTKLAAERQSMYRGHPRPADGLLRGYVPARR
jgi:hypothetical protein